MVVATVAEKLYAGSRGRPAENFALFDKIRTFACHLQLWPPYVIGQAIMFTGSIARSARRRYLIYSEADFKVFSPPGATRRPHGGEIWHGGGAFGPLLHAKFHPHRCNA